MIHLSTLFLLATPLLLAAPILPESLIVSRQVVSQKKGLGHNNPQYLNAFQSSISWAYDWTNNPGGVLPAGIEFVPMLWGADATGWVDGANAAIASGSQHLLGFNEPDLDSQSNISPQAAAALWKANMEPFYGRAKLISPAITNGGSPLGFTWLAEFFQACTGCHFDAMAMHWYDSATNIIYFKNHLQEAYDLFGLPIWLTEFAGAGTIEEQQNFLIAYVDLTAFD